MLLTFKKSIFFLFAILLFLVPLVLWPFTSEVFEFNKMVLTYLLTVLICALWIGKSIIERKFIFRRTILDIPLLIFLSSQIVSTFLSIDINSSVFGYYSRFNGGLLSTVAYLLLYWAFVSNVTKKESLNLALIFISSAVLISVYGVLEHFGIDKNIWVQDVQSRVFSTLGQPNWLAAFLVALIPVTWSLGLINRKRFWIYFLISILFFWTLIFTKSRSGFFALGLAILIFWPVYLWTKKNDFKKNILPAFLTAIAFLIVCLISGTQWTPSLFSLLNQQKTQKVEVVAGTALESGGTESGVIRKIVWQGALDVWKHYPIFGTGVETFAFSYYLYRPAAHNLTSEWDFIYNKAHNEFLNFAANSGTAGLLSYLILIGFIVYVFVKFGHEDNEKILNLGLLSGFVSLAVTNFFGFSVVPTQLEFFLFPAFALTFIPAKDGLNIELKKLAVGHKIGITLILLIAIYLTSLIYKYWNADLLYAKAKAESAANQAEEAYKHLTQAIEYEPDQPVYHGELATFYTSLALAYDSQKDSTHAAEILKIADTEIQKAVSLAPANINLMRTKFGIYIKLSTIDERYLNLAENTVLDTIKMAPTDAKLYYNLGITQANLGDLEGAIKSFQKAIDLKANYSDARIEYAALLVHLNRNQEARDQLNYVLTQIDPSNTMAKAALENLK